MGSSVQTSTAEVGAHKVKPVAGIVFVLDESKAKILDLTDPKIAQKYGYVATTGTTSSSYQDSQQIAKMAKNDGYNVIKYPSVRDQGGVNLAILGDHNDVVKPATTFKVDAPKPPRTPRPPKPPTPPKPKAK